jgi:hypothetical protein
MLEVAHDNCKGLNYFTGYINYYLIEETAALNVSTVRLKLLGCVSRYQWDIVRGKNDFLSLLSITRRYNENRTRNACVVIVSRSVFFSNSYIFVCCFILDDKSTPVFKTVPVHVTTCQQHQIATSQILMVYTQNVCTCWLVLLLLERIHADSFFKTR